MKLIDKSALVAEINKRASHVCGEDLYAEVKRGIYSSLIIYIDSMEEESVSKVWHYQKDEPIREIADKSRPIVVLNAAGEFSYYEDNSDAIFLSNYYRKWAFVEDLINLTPSVIKTSDQERLVSDDLKEAARENAKYERGDDTEVSYDINRYEGFISGANWQKEKDAKLIFNAKEEGYRLGKATMKQQLMKDAVDGNFTFSPVYPENDFIVFEKDRLPKHRLGDKVRVIIIKKE